MRFTASKMKRGFPGNGMEDAAKDEVPRAKYQVTERNVVSSG